MSKVAVIFWSGTVPRCAEKGIAMAADSITVSETPDEDGISNCKALGAART